jgi:tetratricopeptide (TPR) repeat protein
VSRIGWARLLLVAVALASLVAGGASSILSGWADYRIGQGTVVATESAIALTPQRGEYYARLAWLLSEGDPQQAQQALQRAVVLNPRDAKSWMELGLHAEGEGDAHTSEGDLLRAAEIDKTFLPRWTLANYYFRHDDQARFWFWAKEAAAMIYSDGAPLFQLCGRVEEDGQLIERLDIRNPETRSAYLSYLLGKNRLDLIGPSVHRLLEANRLEDVALLFHVCDRLLDKNLVDQAAEIWNGLAEKGRVPFRTPGGEGDQLITNGAFGVPPASQGFDWRLPVVAGVSASLEEPRGLRVTLSGREPEDCELLLQLVPLRRKTHYQLRFEYRTHGIAGGAGLGWRVTDLKSGMILGEGPVPASEEDSEGRFSFKIADETAESPLARVALRYRRTPGTTRSEGFLVLRKVELKPSTQSPIEGSRVK